MACVGKNVTSNNGSSGSSSSTNNAKDNNDRNNNFKSEILDLGDLDLSQLRLTKRDLETLSSITPNLSKNIQDQLLAQLPPNQAKKLSRTLSIQNQTTSSTTGNKKSPDTSQIYRRSVSSNPRSTGDHRHSRDSVTPTNEVFDSINNNTIRNASHYRRSTSRDDKLHDDSINNNRERTLSPDYRKYSKRTSSPSEDIERACFSPPPLSEREKKHSKRYSSKVVATAAEPIYDEPRKQPELATHKILREMREKSQERSVDVENDEKSSYFLNKYAYNEIDKHLQSRNLSTSVSSQSSSVTSAINNKILDELNSISLLNNQLERYDMEAQSKEKTTTAKVKKSSKSSDEKKSSSKIAKESSEEKTFDISGEKSSSKVLSSTSAETKLIRPKSFIAKDVLLKSCDIKDPLSEKVATTESSGNKLERPKSFPSSKITPPKELKKLVDINSIHLEQNGQKIMMNEEAKGSSGGGGEVVEGNGNAEVETKKVKKVVKVVKKSTKKLSSLANGSAQIENQPAAEVDVKREKSPEKKSGGKGLLYTIGQKFEKLRDTKAKQKVDEIKDEKKSEASLPIDLKEKKKKIKAMLNEDVDEITRQERKTKIDALIKNLKDKSVPHSVELTESGLIKRAVSVEEMPNTFNKNAVNKVLGLFKKIEKDNEHKSSRVQNTKSTSFLSSMDASSASSLEYYATNGSSSHGNVARERPKSSGFVNKIKNNGTSSFEPLANICESKIPIKYSCPECKTNPNHDNSLQQQTATTATSASQSSVTKRHSSDDKQSLEEKERLKNNRKGLMLDFSRFKSPEPDAKENKKAANYSFPPPLPEQQQHQHHHHRNAVTPTYDNLANYSSATFDASISSSLSPDDVGDGWSTCSDDHAITHNSLNTNTHSLSRLSRRDSTTLLDEAESPESVVDRIRRKSFYSRFNEKKTKRVSNIVGPAAKDYYRDRSKPLEYTRSATSVIPDLLSSTSTRASSVESATTPHHIRASSISRYTSPSAASRSLSQTRASSTSKYSSNVDSVNDTINHPSSFRRMNNNESNHLATLPPSSYHVHHHSHHHHDLPSLKTSAQDDGISTKLKSNRNTMYDSSSSSSNTPSSLSSLYAKRRSFVSSSPSSSTATASHHYSSSSSMSKPQHTFVDGYATIGRKMRQYNTRSVSLLDPNIINSSNNSYLSEHYRVNGSADSNSHVSRYLS
jgi:serine/arginine repetitive matrix protein 2